MGIEGAVAVVNRPKAGRKAKGESRAEELRQRLIAWKEMPESQRPSLRSLAKELRTSHALLQYYLEGLERWRREKDLERLRANAAAKGVKVTPALERRYLAWLAKIEAQQARGAAKMAKWQAKWQTKLDKWHAEHPGFAEKVRALIETVERQYR